MVRTTGSHWSKSFEVFRLDEFKYPFIVCKMTDHFMFGRTKSTECGCQFSCDSAALLWRNRHLELTAKYSPVFSYMVFKIFRAGFYYIQRVDITFKRCVAPSK